MNRIGGIAIQRPRSPGKRRGKQLRGYVGTYTDGVIALARGAWVKTAGTDDEKRFDATVRLSRNIGDGLVVMQADRVAYAVVTRVHARQWSEAWSVRLLHDATIANGNVNVFGAWKAAG